MTRARLIGLVVGACLSISATAQADPVSDWNSITVAAATAGRAGPPGLLDIALVHAAMHDAVQAIEGNYRPYHYAGTGDGSSAAAAVAAAHRVLVLLYPTQAAGLDATYNAYLLAHSLAGDPGLAVGEAAAIAVHSAHYRPALIVTPHPIDSTGIGEWRSTVPLAFQYLSESKPFALNRGDQFRPPPPPPVGSMTYTRDYDEVKRLGTTANPSGHVAWFWSVNFVAQWNETMRELADTQDLSVGDSARMFALANIAAADAAIAVWDSKVFYNFWRPVTAVREGDNDGNNRTTGLAGWTPLFGTPPYPDYVSGANGLTGAFTGALRLFFNSDAMDFHVTSNSPNSVDKIRSYTSFSQAAQEVVDARILLGIHFRFADEEGRRLGERIAHWTFQKFLRAVPGAK